VVTFFQGVKGEYVESLRESFTVPQGLFTESMERVHGRLAMLGLTGLILVELVKGSALL
jgi:Chlorophyll A-B binding protein